MKTAGTTTIPRENTIITTDIQLTSIQMVNVHTHLTTTQTPILRIILLVIMLAWKARAKMI